MNPKLKAAIFKALMTIVITTFAAYFVMDGVYANRPPFPQPALHRVIPHNYKGSDAVYLAPDEDALFEWIKVIWIACAAVAGLVQGVDYLMEKQQNR
jgi:hypothetical protein